MNVPGIIVARTDAEAATLLEGRGDERDQPFILGATNVELPSYKIWKVHPGESFDLANRPSTGFYSSSIDNGILSMDPY